MVQWGTQFILQDTFGQERELKKRVVKKSKMHKSSSHCRRYILIWSVALCTGRALHPYLPSSSFIALFAICLSQNCTSFCLWTFPTNRAKVQQKQIHFSKVYCLTLISLDCKIPINIVLVYLKTYWTCGLLFILITNSEGHLWALGHLFNLMDCWSRAYRLGWAGCTVAKEHSCTKSPGWNFLLLQILVVSHLSTWAVDKQFGYNWEVAKKTRTCLCALWYRKRVVCSCGLRNCISSPTVWLTCGAFKTFPDRLLSQAEKATISKDRVMELLFLKKTFKMILGAAGTENHWPILWRASLFPRCWLFPQVERQLGEGMLVLHPSKSWSACA